MSRPDEEAADPEGDGGWGASAQAWIADMGERGDFGREHVLDGPMLARVDALRPQSALDVGCGEGRFCRLLCERGVATVGIDPTAALLDRARARHPAGDYRLARAEALPAADASFDLVVSYLTLIDIDDIEAAIAEAVRVLRPGGAFLVANLTSFNTARVDPPGGGPVVIDRYLEPRATWESWRGIRVRNWHRPLRDYMTAFLRHGLILTHFDEPAPNGGDPAKAERYRRAPWYVVMEWRKPTPAKATAP